jgi:glycine cleavage system regulatory protein
MTARLEKGIMEQLTSNLANAKNMKPAELDQMMQRIAGVIENAAGIKVKWELPSSTQKPTQQEQLDQLATLYLGV